MELELVNFEQAKALKGLGFPQKTSYYYNEHIYNEKGNLECCVGYLLTSKDFIAPTLELVAKWLREEKNIAIDIHTYFNVKSGKIQYYECTVTDFKLVYTIEDSYDKVLSKAIDKAIKILKEKKL